MRSITPHFINRPLRPRVVSNQGYTALEHGLSGPATFHLTLQKLFLEKSGWEEGGSWGHSLKNTWPYAHQLKSLPQLLGCFHSISRETEAQKQDPAQGPISWKPPWTAAKRKGKPSPRLRKGVPSVLIVLDSASSPGCIISFSVTWADCLTSLRLSFFTYKMGEILPALLLSGGCYDREVSKWWQDPLSLSGLPRI